MLLLDIKQPKKLFMEVWLLATLQIGLLFLVYYFELLGNKNLNNSVC
jgi:hypothetical protein